VRMTLHINCYSTSEITNCWHSTNECDVIQSTAKLIANCTEEKQGEDYCRRGLECFTRDGAIHKLQHKNEAWDAVFDEQDLQWEDEVYEPECIAEVCRSATLESES
jgi:hypothetical protein